MGDMSKCKHNQAIGYCNECSPNWETDALKQDFEQRLALKDLEIMRLREALETAVEYQRSDVANFHSAYAGYYDEKHEQYDEDLKMVEQALSTPTTYDDLMAWHEEQLGEPVAWMTKSGSFTAIAETKKQLPKGMETPIPLYAKKG